MSNRRAAIAFSAVLVFGTTSAACGEDVVNDDVEREIDEIDENIEDFVDSVFTTDTTITDDTSTTTGG